MTSSLHNHTMYSLQDGFGTPKEMLDRAREIGLKAIAVTEHGSAYSWVYFDKLKKDYPEIKIIYGVELYECFDINVKDKDSKYFHLIALARNEQGRKSLNEIITQSEFKGKYYKPRVDLEMLKPHAENIVILTACLASKIARESDYNKCVGYINEYKSIFPYFYLEMQSHKHEEQEDYNKKILQLSKDTNTKFTITTDSHVAYKEHLKYQGRHVQIARDADTMSELYEGCYMQSDEEIHNIMDSQIGKGNVDLGLKVSDDISDLIEVVNMPFQQPQLPTFPLPKEFKSNKEYLKYLTKEVGWYKREYEKRTKEEQLERDARLDYELDVIDKMGFNGYFLIVWDYINYCIENNYPVGAGRGCFLPNSKITMSNGTLKNIQDVKDGDYVKTHLGNNKKVYNKFKYDVDEKMYEIKAGAFDSIKCTNNHEIYAMQCEKCNNQIYKNVWCTPSCRVKNTCKYSRNNKIGWIKAEDLRVGDYLSVAKVKLENQNKFIIDLADYIQNEDTLITNDYIWIKNPLTHNVFENTKIKRYINIDGDFARFSGYFIGNGYSNFDEENMKYKVEMSFHENHKDKIEDYINLVNTIFGKDTTIIKKYKDKKVVKMYFYSKIASRMLKDLFGDCAKNKIIPDFLICDNNDILHNLLKGLYDTDGHYPNGKENKLDYSTINESLGFQIQKIWLALGFYASVLKCKQRNGWHNEIKVNITGSQLIKVKEYIFPNIKLKNTKYNRVDYIENDTHYFIRISDISTFDYIGKVYDLSVEKDVSYNINGFGVHNSCGGSIVCYLLGISALDPIDYNLIFERFLNIERISMPDIDLDFAYRDKVIEYLMNKYGELNVCQVLNFANITPIIAIKDVGRVLKGEDGKPLIPSSIINSISKLFTEKEFDKCIEINGDLIKKYKGEPYDELFEVARMLSGRVRHVSTHAGGVGIVDTTMYDYMPMKLGDKGEHVIQVDKKIIEDIGIIKFDILGLGTLCIIEGVKNRIGLTDWDIDPNNPKFLNDEKMYELLQKAKTNNVFQVESQGMKDLLIRLQPTSLEDISAVLALYRPDSMSYLENYIYFKHHKDEILYIHEDMKPILETTNGQMIYQEQLMEITRVFGGRTYGGADKFRKGIGKKDVELVKKEANDLYEEIINNKYNEKIAKEISDDLMTKGGLSI